VAALLRANPAAKGVLFDRPNVIAEARHVIHGLGLNERVELVEGDFFEEVPAGADLYLLKWILHDWMMPNPEPSSLLAGWPCFSCLWGGPS
jgi:hypothetical protein